MAENEVFGYLDAESFSIETPISYDSYFGNLDAKWEMIEFARISLDELIEYMDWFLGKYELGITANDLGFLKY